MPVRWLQKDFIEEKSQKNNNNDKTMYAHENLQSRLCLDSVCYCERKKQMVVIQHFALKTAEFDPVSTTADICHYRHCQKFQSCVKNQVEHKRDYFWQNRYLICHHPKTKCNIC